MKQRTPFARLTQAQANSRSNAMDIERKPLPKFKYNYQPRKENPQIESSISSKYRKSSLQNVADAQEMEIEDDQKCVFVNGRKYFIVKEIGKGGQSVVYVAKDTANEKYALKIVDTSNPSVNEAMIRKEIELLSEFRHQNRIIQLIDSEIDEENKRIYILQELGDKDLRTILQEKFSSDEDQFDGEFIRCIWKEMVEAVEACHKKDILHADLKPENFIFVKGHLKLIDFGIATRVNTRPDTTSITRETPIGTLAYMAPEALTIQTDEKKVKVGKPADIWALGCILYRLVYRRRPYPQEDIFSFINAINGTSFKVEYGPLEYAEDPEELPFIINIIKQCLVQDPKMRSEIADIVRHPYTSNQCIAMKLKFRQFFRKFFKYIQDNYDEGSSFKNKAGQSIIIQYIAEEGIEEYADLLRVDLVPDLLNIGTDLTNRYFNVEFGEHLMPIIDCITDHLYEAENISLPKAVEYVINRRA